ncbi:TRAPP trafficking subunit Trs65-domain-containing protein [Echria macrotheca]|uniref:TRAPP trafficking subunit Trs65-domain-containing protein n=1 Tax=Echria macrotheca TaxID=438768 RepID=A0AAJ0BFS6_9PEZI|nr:TRAPP trafficking subunit Trs65-domain-containing protein [Echria macrotheca]
MAVPDLDEAGEDGASLAQHSYLSYFIPAATNFSPEDHLQTGEEPIQDKLGAVEQRDLLFFDETVDVFLVLRAHAAEQPEPEELLSSHLDRIVISLDAKIVNSHAPDRDSPPASETVYTGAVDVDTVPYIIADKQVGDDGDRYVYALWKLPVFLARPKIRLQGPSVVFSASAGIKPRESGGSNGHNNGYMQSCVPSGMNLLEAFADDPMLGGVKPQLSALRVSRVAPVTQSRDSLQRIEGLKNLRLKIYPVVHTRVRFSRPNTTPPSPALIALLEVDFTPFFECEAALEKIALVVPDSTIEDLNSEDGMALPLSCVAHDHLTFLYKLAPQHLDTVLKNPTRDLAIAISVVVLVNPDGPNRCTPRLTMTWTTNIDYTLPVNPGFGQPMTQPIQRAHRPSQLSISGGVDVQSLISPSVSRPDALPSLEAATARPIETAVPDFGITMTFTGPTKPVYVGEEFSWSVFIVNRTKHDNPTNLPPGTAPPAAAAAAAAAARKLALLVVPKRRRNDLRVIRPPSSSGPGRHDPLVADAVLDENVVHAMHRSSAVDAANVVSLSADVRIGPLAPRACAVVELRFLALREGIVGIEAVRVVDLGSQEHVDVRELPTVLVRSRE